MKRRDALAGGIGALGGLWLPACDADVPNDTHAAFAMPPCELEALVARFMEASDTFVPLEELLREGEETNTLYMAAHTIAARIIHPENDVHLAAGIRAMHLMSERVTTVDPLMPLFMAWESIRVGLTFFNPDSPVVDELLETDLPAPGEAVDALVAALEAWDSNKAQAAMLSLYDDGGAEAVVGPLTLYGQRNQHWVGHPTIWTAYALRSLETFGWQCAPSVLRALARAYAFGEAGSETAAAFYSNRERVSEVPANWRDGSDDPAAVPDLLNVFRVGDADTCVDTVIETLNNGVSQRTIWTALDIVAVELSVRWQHGSWGVHELDANNGFRYLQRFTPDPDTAVLALLQSAAWRPLFRGFVADLGPKFDEGLDELEPAAGEPPTLDAAFASLENSRVDAARILKSYFIGGGTPEEVISAWPDIVVRHASMDAHHYKFHAALLEETEAALPEWRQTLLLGITMRGPSPTDPTWERHDEAAAIIASLK